MRDNKRESGARKLEERPELEPQIDPRKAVQKPEEPFGLTRNVDETRESTRTRTQRGEQPSPPDKDER